MILFLLFYTYERIEKLLEEDTGMSYTIMEDGGAELPSFTICFYEFRKKLYHVNMHVYRTLIFLFLNECYYKYTIKVTTYKI